MSVHERESHHAALNQGWPSVRVCAARVARARLGWWLRLVVLLLLFVPASRARAQGNDRCDLHVRDVTIAGATLEPAELLTVLATERPSFTTRTFGLGSRPCVDTLAVRLDALRIAVLHRQRGWFQAQVTSRLEQSGELATVRFTVEPGPIARVASVEVVTGPRADSVPAPAIATRFTAPLQALEGAVFDRVRVQAASDESWQRLRDAGYARAAEPQVGVVIDTARAEAALTVTLDPGQPLTIGAIHVELAPVAGRAPRLDSSAVRELSHLRAGDRYRATDIVDAERRLYATEAFRLVLIDTMPAEVGQRDSMIDVRITVGEARTRSGRLGAGWGTLECGRLQGRLSDRGFLGPGRRVELVARASRIGIGRPLDQLPGLCPQFLRDDPYSQELNYYLGVSLTSASFFTLPIAPALNVYSERRGEYNAFLRETDIGVNLSLARQLSRRNTGRISLEYESGRTVTDAVLACVRFGLCQPADFELARQGNSTRALNLALVHDRVGNVVDPRYGGRLRVDGRVGQTAFRGLEQVADTFGSYNFYRPSIEASGFTWLAGGTVAARVQWSQVYAPNAFRIAGVPFLPPQERLYSGGQNSVRGYQQNLLGPTVYRVDRSGVDSVPFGSSYQLVVNPAAAVRTPSPEGGTGTLVANLEYRRRFAWPTRDLQWVAFLDAGTVWATGVAAFSASEVRATPGLGLRLDTPLGPFRVDIGYNPRRAEAGKVFLFDNLREGTSTTSTPFVICVSPGQEVSFEEQLAAGGFACPRSFVPASSRSTLSRLVFHFSLGQAF